MSGLAFVLAIVVLAAAIPLGIVVFTVLLTKRTSPREHAPASRFFSAFVFGVSALSGVVLLFGGSASTVLITGIPAAVIAALLAAAGHRLLVGHSRLRAGLTGLCIALLTPLGTAAFFALIIAPDPGAALFMAATTIVLVMHAGNFSLVIGLCISFCSGLLLNHLANRRPPAAPASQGASAP